MEEHFVEEGRGVRAKCWSYGVMVSTLDSESSDPGSNPGMTSSFLFPCLLHHNHIYIHGFTVYLPIATRHPLYFFYPHIFVLLPALALVFSAQC